MSEWRECVRYLQHANVLPILSENVKNSLEHSDPNVEYEIANYLKDGVVLCRLLNFIKPHELPKTNFSSRPQSSRYLAGRNIESFLNICENVFKLPKKDLFSVDDLLEARNLKKVLNTISKLSQSKLAQQYFGDGFSVSSSASKSHNAIAPPSSISLSAPPPPRPFTDEEVYRNVNDIMIENEEEELYKKFIDVKQRSSIVAPLSKKDMCINELISTEESYVNVLRDLIQHFKIPLTPILLKNSIEKIFFKIEEMYQIHEMFLQKLKNSQIEDSRTSVAECFISCKEWFLLYGEYCANVTDAQNHIEELMKMPDIRKAIEKCEQNYKDGKRKFRDIFILPMQRVLKYPLFMMQCYKENKDEFQRSILSKAIEEVEDLAQYINEVKRDIENLKNIEKIEKSIKDFHKILPPGAQLKNYGKLVKDGELKVKELDKECVVFLLDKILLICTKSKNELVLSNYCTLSKYQVQQQSDKDGKTFTLVNTVLSKDNVTFKAKDRLDKEDWVKAIELSKQNSSPVSPPNTKFNFKMETYDTPTICDVCKKLLKGKFFQGYHCANTNKNVHKECIANAHFQTIPTLTEKVKSYGLVMTEYRGNPKPPVEYNVMHLLEKSVVQVLSINNEWALGRCDNRKGYFPKAFIIEFNHKPTHAEIMQIFKERTEVSDSWFVGEIDRAVSHSLMAKTPNGTFLVRKKTEDTFVIDIKFNNIYPIMIERELYKFFIDPRYTFNSVKSLIEFYENNSLGNSFSEVPTKLLYPINEVVKIQRANPRTLNLCRATFPYKPPHKTTDRLGFEKGDIIIVLNTNVGYEGWWQGQLGNKIGYFPSSYVDYAPN